MLIDSDLSYTLCTTVQRSLYFWENVYSAKKPRLVTLKGYIDFRKGMVTVRTHPPLNGTVRDQCEGPVGVREMQEYTIIDNGNFKKHKLVGNATALVLSLMRTVFACPILHYQQIYKTIVANTICGRCSFPLINQIYCC